MLMKIIFLDSYTLSLNGDVDVRPVAELGNYYQYNLTNKDAIINYCKDTEIIITNKILINREIIEKSKYLKLICAIATGFNHIDVESAKKNNVPVVNAPEYAKYSVSQHVFALILNFATKASEYFDSVKNNEWQKSKASNLLKYPTFELAGKTIGIIGFGSIGKETAAIAASFKMNVLIYDIFDVSSYGYKKSSLSQILLNSDIITIHCPLTKETLNLITKKELMKMKRNAILINTSRGGIVNEADLAEALNSEKIGGAGFDVLTNEPPIEGNPLLGDVKNLYLTPHSAWSTFEARQRLINITAENIKSFLDGNIINLVY